MEQGFYISYFNLILILVPTILCALMNKVTEPQKKILQGILIFFLGGMLIYHIYFRN